MATKQKGHANVNVYIPEDFYPIIEEFETMLLKDPLLANIARRKPKMLLSLGIRNLIRAYVEKEKHRRGLQNEIVVQK